MNDDRPIPEPAITRGADLTDEDLKILASDMLAVTIWAFKLGLKKPKWEAELENTLRWRLGRTA